MPQRPRVLTHPWHHTRHHRPGGFRNDGRDERDEVPRLRTAGWMLTYALRPVPAQRPAPRQPLDPAALAIPPEGVRVTWLGHSTFLLQLGPVNVLTDPVFSKRASPFSFAGPAREAALPLDPAALPPVHLVLLSHDHYDHLDPAAVAWLDGRDRPLVLAPLGVGARLGAARVVELDWWQYVEVVGLKVHAAPARHFSGRTLWDRDRTLWASWYLEPAAGGQAVYYAGDTAYGGHFAEVRERLGAPEVALVPIGAYDPRWLMARVHVNPEEALQGFLDLGARHFVPAHWGTFRMAEEPLDEPPRRLLERASTLGLDGRVHVLPVGGQVAL